MVAKGYPELTIEDWREYSLLGCTETNLPHITMGNLYEANQRRRQNTGIGHQ